MLSRILLLLSLIAVILPSGCILDGNGLDDHPPEGYGMIAENFAPDFQQVYSGEDVTFTLKVRNTGSVKASGGFAELLGLDQTWRGGEGSTANTAGTEIFPVEQECRYTNQGIDLLPPDPSSGISGGDYICTWKYIAPQVRVGLHADYTPRARFYYNYESFTTKTLTLIPKEDLKAYQNQGKTLPMETKDQSDSPLSLDIEMQTPIRTYGSSVEFPAVIKISNIGDGTVCSDANHCKKYPYISGQSTTEGPSWDQFTLRIELGEGLQLSTCNPEQIIYLSGGKDQTISCKITASVPQELSQRQIILIADYGYFFDTATSITVLPSPVPG